MKLKLCLSSRLSDTSVLAETSSDEVKLSLAFNAVTRQLKQLEEEKTELLRKVQGTNDEFILFFILFIFDSRSVGESFGDCSVQLPCAFYPLSNL